MSQSYPDDECVEVCTKKGTILTRMHIPSGTLLVFAPPGTIHEPDRAYASPAEWDGKFCWKFILESKEAVDAAMAATKHLTEYAEAGGQ